MNIAQGTASDYISRKAAQDEACDRCNQQEHCNRPELCPLIISIKSIPAADVREVSYAEDISDTVKGHHCEFKCSHCREEIAECWGRDFDFCPYCGAVLRKQDG
jgi:hypothetical protein